MVFTDELHSSNFRLKEQAENAVGHLQYIPTNMYTVYSFFVYVSEAIRKDKGILITGNNDKNKVQKRCSYFMRRTLTRYAKLGFAHAPPHHGTCVTHVPWCIPGSLTSCFLWSRWREKRSWHSRRLRNPQCCVFGLRPMNDNLCFVPGAFRNHQDGCGLRTGGRKPCVFWSSLEAEIRF